MQSWVKLQGLVFFFFFSLNYTNYPCVVPPGSKARFSFTPVIRKEDRLSLKSYPRKDKRKVPPKKKSLFCLVKCYGHCHFPKSTLCLMLFPPTMSLKAVLIPQIQKLFFTDWDVILSLERNQIMLLLRLLPRTLSSQSHWFGHSQKNQRELLAVNFIIPKWLLQLGLAPNSLNSTAHSKSSRFFPL